MLNCSYQPNRKDNVNATMERTKIRRRQLAETLGIDLNSLRYHVIRDTGPPIHYDAEYTTRRGNTVQGKAYYYVDEVGPWLEKRAATLSLGRTLEQLERWNAYLETNHTHTPEGPTKP